MTGKGARGCGVRGVRGGLQFLHAALCGDMHNRPFAGLPCLCNPCPVVSLASHHPVSPCCCSVRPVYDFDRLESFEDYRTKELTVATIRADIAKFKEWEREVR